MKTVTMVACYVCCATAMNQLFQLHRPSFGLTVVNVDVGSTMFVLLGKTQLPDSTFVRTVQTNSRVVFFRLIFFFVSVE